jgi:hypothetical protein
MFRVCLHPLRRSLGKTPLRRVSKYERKLMQEVKKLRKQVQELEAIKAYESRRKRKKIEVSEARVTHIRSMLRFAQEQVREEKEKVRKYEELHNKKQEIIDSQIMTIRRQKGLIDWADSIMARLGATAPGEDEQQPPQPPSPPPPPVAPPPPPLDAPGGPLAPAMPPRCVGPPTLAVDTYVETDVEDEESDDSDICVVDVQLPSARRARD